MCAIAVLGLRHVNLISGVGWHDFHKKIRKAKRVAFHPGIFANLKCHLRTYLLFCGAFDRQPLQVHRDTICAYSCFLALLRVHFLPCCGNLNLQTHLEKLSMSMSMNNLLEGILGSVRKAWLYQLSGQRQDIFIIIIIYLHIHNFTAGEIMLLN